MDLFGTEPKSSAVLSECGVYRYRLTRVWDADAPQACFVMLNPSTADATHDDPTIRRCLGFARSWRCGGIEVVNLFAFRATDPEALLDAADPIGPGNGDHIHEAAVRCRPVVAAWGAHAKARGRANYVAHGLRQAGVVLKCLGVTKDGFPRHPLYVNATAELADYLS